VSDVQECENALRETFGEINFTCKPHEETIADVQSPSLKSSKMRLKKHRKESLF